MNTERADYYQTIQTEKEYFGPFLYLVFVHEPTPSRIV